MYEVCFFSWSFYDWIEFSNFYVFHGLAVNTCAQWGEDNEFIGVNRLLFIRKTKEIGGIDR